MGHEPDNSVHLAPVAWAHSPQRAQVTAAILHAAGIDAFVPNENVSTLLCHMQYALHPHGLRVMVRQDDLASAREVLAQVQPVADVPGVSFDIPPGNPADDYAAKAAVSAVYTLWIPPIALWAVCCAVKALRASEDKPPERLGRFRFRICVALLAGALLVVMFLLGYVQQAGWLE